MIPSIGYFLVALKQSMESYTEAELDHLCKGIDWTYSFESDSNLYFQNRLTNYF